MDAQIKRRLAQDLSRLDHLSPDDKLPLPDGGRELGWAFRIGITGPLGAGKSTLINEVVRNYRARDMTIGVIAVDPSSPFTGGALLGDRVRMTELVSDEGVFIRSLATRGMTGGLALTAVDAADLLDSYGFDRIILETVGVGQSEVDIAGACDAACVVFEPGSGDGIQAMKAGLMEIADLFIVNKKDKKGSDKFIMDLASALDMRTNDTRPEILATSAQTADGVTQLVDWLEGFFRKVSAEGDLAERRATQRAKRIKRLADDAAVRRFWRNLTDEQIRSVIVSNSQVREAVRQLVEAGMGGVSEKSNI